MAGSASQVCGFKQLAINGTSYKDLSLNLSGDDDIKKALRELEELSRKCSKDFRKIIGNMKECVLLEKSKLNRFSTITEVNVQSILDVISSMNDMVQVSVEDFNGIDKTTKALMTTCTLRIVQKQNLASKKELEQTKMENQLKEYECKLRWLEAEITQLNRDADELLNRAYELDNEEKEKEKRAGASFLFGTVLAVVTAPFSAGLSLAALSVGAAAGGFNLTNASGCRSGAKIKRSSAEEKRDESRQLEAKKSSLECDMANNKISIDNLRREIGTLLSDEKVLKELEMGTKTYLNVLFEIDKNHKLIKQLLITLSLETESFQMEQILNEGEYEIKEKTNTGSNESFQMLLDAWDSLKITLDDY
ncbi:uncharacterized protein LOC127858686 [Dreissena polymorpha]|uniref:Uncharacterized protein n=1 Tax=Dreissena polymorpha TaxID=45954 RepID=A0A9D4BS68_DREPO|nr:uncharacterized protein LOC127858686 [Dreissena polymorpha]KAH3707210.1 hypothetical protein DPMN_066609 [Dreissena polymorpha]